MTPSPQERTPKSGGRKHEIHRTCQIDDGPHHAGTKLHRPPQLLRRFAAQAQGAQAGAQAKVGAGAGQQLQGGTEVFGGT